MDALIKSLNPRKSDVKPSETKTPEMRPAELDPAEFLAAAVRADQPRPSRAEAEHAGGAARSEEHTSELQSHHDLVCRLLLEKKKKGQARILVTTTDKAR